MSGKDIGRRQDKGRWSYKGFYGLIPMEGRVWLRNRRRMPVDARSLEGLLGGDRKATGNGMPPAHDGWPVDREATAEAEERPWPCQPHHYSVGTQLQRDTGTGKVPPPESFDFCPVLYLLRILPPRSSVTREDALNERVVPPLLRL